RPRRRFRWVSLRRRRLAHGHPGSATPEYGAARGRESIGSGRLFRPNPIDATMGAVPIRGAVAEGPMDWGILEWGAGLRPLIRFGIAGTCLLVSTVLLLFGEVWIWGWVVGAVLLVFAFPSHAEKKGYHDF